MICVICILQDRQIIFHQLRRYITPLIQPSFLALLIRKAIWSKSVRMRGTARKGGDALEDEADGDSKVQNEAIALVNEGGGRTVTNSCCWYGPYFARKYWRRQGSLPSSAHQPGHRLHWRWKLKDPDVLLISSLSIAFKWMKIICQIVTYLIYILPHHG
jgi:hypothetical protein